METPTAPIVVDDEIWIYYGGMKVRHDWWLSGQQAGMDEPEVHDPELSRNGHHLCLAKLRLDGWVSLNAGVHEGTVETKPLFSMAPNLFINARCQTGGFLRNPDLYGFQFSG